MTTVSFDSPGPIGLGSRHLLEAKPSPNDTPNGLHGNRQSQSLAVLHMSLGDGNNEQVLKEEATPLAATRGLPVSCKNPFISRDVQLG